MKGKGQWRRLLTDARPLWWALCLALLGNVCYSLIDASFVYFLKPLLDKGFVARDLSFLRWLPVVLMGLFLFRGVSSLCANYGIHYVGLGLVQHYRNALFEKYLHYPARFLDKTNGSDLLSVHIYHLNQLAQACTESVTIVLKSSVLVLGLLVVMLINSWQFTAIFVLTLPCIAILSKYASVRMRRLNENIQHSVGALTHIVEESLTGYREIRLFGAQAYEKNKYEKAVGRNRFLELKVVLTRTLSSSAVQLFAAMALAVIIYLATMTHGFGVSAGGFVSFVSAMFALLKPLKDLSTVNASIQRGLAALQRVFELLEGPIEVDAGQLEVQEFRGEVTFEQVGFAYEKKKVLFEVNFQLRPGEITAIVGRSGSGKSTLVQLLLRFYQPTEGRILLDGIDLQDYRLSSLREKLAIVSQHVVLFNDTVAANVAYGQSEFTNDRVRLALEEANAWSFVQELPQGLETPIGDNGVLLSGGQRQRLALARAIFKAAPILILDEATSALDSESEQVINQALAMRSKKTTMLVIAHRLSTIEQAQQILVMDNQTIVESGTHRQLLSKGGLYAKLHQLQFQSYG